VGKGRLARGYDADFTIIDVKKKQTITNAQQLSRTAWTPFDGMEVTGWPVITIVNGKIVARNGQLGDGQAGQMVKFEENAKSF